jgi:(2Fe-2S) ferredoxin
MPKFEKHIFICGNQRPPGNPRGSCDPKGQAELHKAFKRILAERGVAGTRVRANRSGCLEQCEHGPTVVVYPDAIWYGGVRPEDVAEIVDSHILRKVPVDRLRLAEDCVNTPSCKHRLPRPTLSSSLEPERH